LNGPARLGHQLAGINKIGHWHRVISINISVNRLYYQKKNTEN